MSILKLFNIFESISRPERDMFEGFNEMELSEEYPKGFDLGQFKSLYSYAKKMKYAESHLGKPLGRGSSRVVYRIDETKVLKLAKNRKGIAQNEAEINFYGNTYYDDIIAQVIDFDRDNNLWVEMELALKPKKSDFNRLWNVNIDDLHYYLDNRYREQNGLKHRFSLPDDVKSDLDNNEDVGQLVSFMYDSVTLPADLSRINSWGLVKRPYGESLVLIDFGFTEEVYESYYK